MSKGTTAVTQERLPNNVGKCLCDFKLQLLQKALMNHYSGRNDPAGIERCRRERFADWRANDEWFEISLEDIEPFERRQKYI